MNIKVELSSDSIASLSSARMAVHIGSPVLALARKLIGMGVDPATSLECYRGPMHCLTIRSIGEVANLSVVDGRFQRAREAASAPPISATLPSPVAA